jgi:hypothetical protein
MYSPCEDTQIDISELTYKLNVYIPEKKRSFFEGLGGQGGNSNYAVNLLHQSVTQTRDS